MIQREHERIPLATPVGLKADGRTVEGVECCNISMGGMCLQVRNSTENWRIVAVCLEKWIGGEAIRLEAEADVMWSKPAEPGTGYHQIGIKFKELGPENRKSLVRIIVEQLRENDAAKSP